MPWKPQPADAGTPAGAGRDRTQELTSDVERTGYYPDIVNAGIGDALAGEPVTSYFVHHEATMEHDEVRRHATVVVLTPTRLVLTHTDDYPGDDLLPEPHTTSTSDAIALSSVRSVGVTRLVTNASRGADPADPAEAVVAASWSGGSRLDLEPAGCADPECDADHGYTGTLSRDDFTLRVSAAADGAEAVRRVLAFARDLSAATRATGP